MGSLVNKQLVLELIIGLAVELGLNWWMLTTNSIIAKLALGSSTVMVAIAYAVVKSSQNNKNN